MVHIFLRTQNCLKSRIINLYPPRDILNFHSLAPQYLSPYFLPRGFPPKLINNSFIKLMWIYEAEITPARYELRKTLKVITRNVFSIQMRINSPIS